MEENITEKVEDPLSFVILIFRNDGQSIPYSHICPLTFLTWHTHFNEILNIAFDIAISILD